MHHYLCLQIACSAEVCKQSKFLHRRITCPHNSQPGIQSNEMTDFGTSSFQSKLTRCGEICEQEKLFSYTLHTCCMLLFVQTLCPPWLLTVCTDSHNTL